MNNNNFSFEQLDSLNFTDQKVYLTIFFIPLSNGTHCFLNNGVYEMMTDEVINKVYFKRCGKKLKEYYTEEYRTICNPVYEINKPIFYENKINLCPQLPSYSPYKDFPKNIKDKCQKFLKMSKFFKKMSNFLKKKMSKKLKNVKKIEKCQKIKNIDFYRL